MTSGLTLCIVARPTRLPALLSSVLIHAIALALVTRFFAVANAPRQQASVRMELLRLDLIPAKATPGKAFWTKPAPKASGGRPLLSRRRGKSAPQTLIVFEAPPRLQLAAQMPLPLMQVWGSLSSTAVNPRSEARQRISPERAVPVPPEEPVRGNVISVPDNPSVAKETELLPKVNQVAGPSPSEAAGDAGQSTSVNPSPGLPAAAGIHDSDGAVPAAESAATVGEPRKGDRGQIENKPEKSARWTRIDRPAGGKFSMSVLGASVTEQYPGTHTGVTGRIVSTVYLNVGARKRWTLEYCALAAQAAGTHPDAPWPYLMYLPDQFPMPSDTDSLLIGGVLDSSGRLQDLHIVLPERWPEQEEVLRALKHWEFRPAARKGNPVAVEVLLIIPREDAHQ